MNISWITLEFNCRCNMWKEKP